MPVLPVQLKVKLLREGAQVPVYAKPGDSGADIRFCMEGDDRISDRISDCVSLLPGETIKFPTGLAFEIPEGYEIQLRPRSGVSSMEVLCHWGTVDTLYRGEVKVLLTNLGSDTYVVHHGDRIAQMVLAPVVRAGFEVTETLSETVRGATGFGSSGVK